MEGLHRIFGLEFLAKELKKRFFLYFEKYREIVTEKLRRYIEGTKWNFERFYREIVCNIL